jgi:hypothetical protein
VGPEGLKIEGVQRIARQQAGLFETVIKTVSAEHGREVRRLSQSPAGRRAERIHRMLEGEPVDSSVLAYNLDNWHLGVHGSGREAGATVRNLAAALDRSLLLLPDDEDTIRAWLGGARQQSVDRALTWARENSPSGVTLAFGEEAAGVQGWRLTHMQAVAGLPIALQSGERAVRYADVALTASIVRDGLLTESLRIRYLIPLAADRDGGETLRATLRAYFATERHVSSAAAVLGVSRRTVANRLRSVEAILGRPLGAIMTELDAALRIDSLDSPVNRPEHSPEQ